MCVLLILYICVFSDSSRARACARGMGRRAELGWQRCGLCAAIEEGSHVGFVFVDSVYLCLFRFVSC